jgi:hypothetical protein
MVLKESLRRELSCSDGYLTGASVFSTAISAAARIRSDLNIDGCGKAEEWVGLKGVA